jgi:glycosyltransferase involved in cell wall biosynthesis
LAESGIADPFAVLLGSTDFRKAGYMRLSVITVCLNSQETIAATARSVCEQSYPDVEYLVIDGGSRDGTLPQLEPYRYRIAAVISEPDRGLYDAMNKGLALATGDVIGFLHADDQYMDSDVLARVADVFADDAVAACYGDLVYVDAKDQDRVTRHWRAGLLTRRKLYHGWMPPHPTFFVRRQYYQQYGGYRLDLGTAADYELMLRYLLRHHLQAAYLPHILVHMLSGGVSNRSIASRLRAHCNDWKAWQVNGLMPLPWTVFCKPLRKVAQWWVS